MSKNSYYGPKIVVAKEKVGDDMIFTLDDESKEKVNKLLVDVALSDKPVDLTAHRNAMMKPVVKEVLEVLLKYNLHPFAPKGELGYVLETVKASFFENYSKAIEKSFGVKEAEVRLSDIDKILKDEVRS